MVSHFGVGEFTTNFRTYFSGWIGMFTGNTLGSLTHSHVGFYGTHLDALLLSVRQATQLLQQFLAESPQLRQLQSESQWARFVVRGSRPAV